MKPKTSVTTVQQLDSLVNSEPITQRETLIEICHLKLMIPCLRSEI